MPPVRTRERGAADAGDPQIAEGRPHAAVHDESDGELASDWAARVRRLPA